MAFWSIVKLSPPPITFHETPPHLEERKLKKLLERNPAYQDICGHIQLMHNSKTGKTGEVAANLYGANGESTWIVKGPYENRRDFADRILNNPVWSVYA